MRRDADRLEYRNWEVLIEDSECNLSITHKVIWTIKQDQGNCFLVSLII